jgi:hypothetical protein
MQGCQFVTVIFSVIILWYCSVSLLFYVCKHMGFFHNKLSSIWPIILKFEDDFKRFLSDSNPTDFQSKGSNKGAKNCWLAAVISSPLFQCIFCFVWCCQINSITVTNWQPCIFKYLIQGFYVWQRLFHKNLRRERRSKGYFKKYLLSMQFPQQLQQSPD